MAIVLLLISAAAAASLLYAIWKIRWGSPPGPFPAVLAYHKVGGFEFGGTWITPARFAGHLDRLLDSGRRFISEEDFLASLGGSRERDPGEILLTFDDAYAMLAGNAIPALAERKIPALIFVVTEYAGRDNAWELPLPGRRAAHMSWEEIRRISDAGGVTFGSHSGFHRDLTKYTPGELERELAASKKAIEERTGRPARSFSYPYGRVNQAVAEAVRKAGYEAAFTLYPPGKIAAVDPFMLRREGVWVIDTGRSLLNKLPGSAIFWFEDVKGRSINAFAGMSLPRGRNDPSRR